MLYFFHEIMEKNNDTTGTELEKTIEKYLYQAINRPEKFKFIVDQQYFSNMCYEITMILSKFGFFLRIYELKKNTDIFL